MSQPLSAKEALFCTYYCLRRNGREAAAKSGYRRPEHAAQRLLARPCIREYIEKADAQTRSEKADVAAGYARLAFGCAADAVRLLRASDDEDLDLDTMDLFLISEIKKPKNGGMEIKFHDRLRALERLEALVARDESAGAGLFSAIAASADALRKADSDD